MFERIFAIIKKEKAMILRDKVTLIMSFLLPIIEIILFGFAIHLDVKHIPIAVVDQSMDAESRAYIDALVNSQSFDIVETPLTQAGAQESIDYNRVYGAVVIPHDFEAKVQRNEAEVLVLVDGADPFNSLHVYNQMSNVSLQHTVDLVFEKAGSVLGGGAELKEPLNSSVRVLFNPDIQDLWFVIPCIIVVILQVLAITLVSNSIVREREIGTMEQILVTPIKPTELLIGKLIPNIALVLLNLFVILFIGMAFFKVPFAGNIFEFILMSLVYIVACVGLGLLVSTVSKNQRQAVQYIIMITMISISLSGFAFPRSQMPKILYYIGYLIPMTYFVPVSRNVMNKGVGIATVYPEIAALVIYGLVIMFIASKAFKKKLD